MKRPGGFDREHHANAEARRLRGGGPELDVDPRTSSEWHVEHDPAGAEEQAGNSGDELQPAEARRHAAGLAKIPAREGGLLGSLRQRLSSGREVDPITAAERRVRDAERRTKRRERRETRRFTAAARAARRRLFIVLGTVASLMLFVAVVVFTPLMAVTEVRIQGAQTVSETDLERALARFDGVPLALVDENEVLRALEAFPLIQRFAVERLPPHTLLVRIEERTPVVSVQKDDAYLLYDAAGVLVGRAAERPAGVPLGVDTAQQVSTKAFTAAARVVRDLPTELRAQVVEVGAKTGQDVTLTFDSGIKVFWGNTQKTKRKAVILEAMLASLADRPVTYIDVSSTEAPVFR